MLLLLIYKAIISHFGDNRRKTFPINIPYKLHISVIRKTQKKRSMGLNVART